VSLVYVVGRKAGRQERKRKESRKMLLSIHRDDAILCVSTALLLQAVGASRMGYPPTILRMRSDPHVTHL
jgi:hypothetical protein